MIIITGQTATGKTKLALELAQKQNGELINCDSRQVYKYLDIITGKYVDKKIKTWLLDIVTPDQYFSSFDYKQCATNVINQLVAQNKTPIIVGGTYFYLKHLLYGIASENIPPNFKLREELNQKSVPELQEMLKKLSVQSLENLNKSDRNNPQRLIRRIEILSFSPPKSPIPPNSPISLIKTFKIKIIGLRFRIKSKLRQAIINRVEDRLKCGAINEVKNILKMGYKETDPGLKTIGYNQIIRYLKGELTKQKAIEEWINREVQYAKRQYTFMKKDPNIQWKEV